MSKKVSMDDIAKKLSISKNTVSLALRSMPGISEATRSLVIKTAEQLGYDYKKTATSIPEKAQTCGNICLILSRHTYNSMDFFSYIQLGIESEAKKNNFTTILYCYDEEDNLFETPFCINDGIVSGIVTLGKISEKTATSIKNYNLPFVMVDHYFDHIISDCVISDNHSGGYQATKYLISKGHKKIGFLGNIESSISFYDRFDGFLKALEDFKLPLDDTIYCTYENSENPQESLDKFTIKIKSMDEPPTAFFCCNDVESIALIKSLSALSISVPKDISIIGFDNIEASKNISPELTTMHVSKEQMGKRAVQKLLSLMQDQSVPQEKILISTMLVERQSVKLKL